MTSVWSQWIGYFGDVKVFTIIITVFFAFAVIFLGLIENIMIITPLLFYIPILVASYWFPRTAVLFAIVIGAANILIVAVYTYPNIMNLTYITATASFYVLIALSLIISSLTQKIKAQEARYHEIFNHSDIGIFLVEGVNDDLRIVEVNSKGLAIFGCSPVQITGKPLSVVIPKDQSRQSMMEQIRANHRFLITISILNRKNGTTIPVLISGAQMPDGMIVLNVMDISDQKKIEEELQRSLTEKEILLREVHHRVKNNMQVISGLIELQSMQITDPEIQRLFQESHNRIKTMALIHESLYRSNDYARIDFISYLNELTSYLLTSYGRSEKEITIDIQFAETHMSLELAIPCGLIANELISNCLKHAFPDGKRGVITIRLEKEGENEYRFSVSDDGIGFPADLDIKTAKSFGLSLINGLVTHQMRGTLELRGQTGTTVVIRYPGIT
jgi:PAS domain S-box-containing protein